MGTVTMGKVLISARIENLRDLYNVEQGLLRPDQVRTVEVEDALVDTGATLLALPRRLIRQLGLAQHRSRRGMTASGPQEFGIYEVVRLTVQDRDCAVEVTEVPDECPVLIGQIPLEVLDFVVHPQSQKLVGNPAHHGEQMIEVY